MAKGRGGDEIIVIRPGYLYLIYEIIVNIYRSNKGDKSIIKPEVIFRSRKIHIYSRLPLRALTLILCNLPLSAFPGYTFSGLFRLRVVRGLIRLIKWKDIYFDILSIRSELFRQVTSQRFHSAVSEDQAHGDSLAELLLDACKEQHGH